MTPSFKRCPPGAGQGRGELPPAHAALPGRAPGLRPRARVASQFEIRGAESTKRTPYGQPSGVCHISTGGGCAAEGAVANNPPSRRGAAAGPCAAMTAVHPVASRSARPARCVLRRSKCALTAPSQCPDCAPTVRKGHWPDFLSPDQPDRERTTAYRDSSGPNSRSNALCATILGDSEKPSGENPDSNKEKQVWVIREKKTKAGGKNRKRPNLI